MVTLNQIQDSIINLVPHYLNLLLPIVFIIAALLLPTGSVAQFQSKLTASDLKDYMQVGISTSIKDNLLVVGAYTDERGSQSGSAFIFVKLEVHGLKKLN